MNKLNFKVLCFVIAFLIASVDLSGQFVGRVYKDDCYQNSYQSMYYPNSYKKSNLSFGNDRISSVKIYNNRYYIRLYEHDNFNGEYRDIYSNMKDLSTIDFEDETSSIRVRKSYTTLPTANEETISANILNGSGLETISSKKYYLPKHAVDYNTRIHMQSLALNKAGNRVVMTGCRASGPTSGCTGKSYILLFDANGNFKDSYVPQRPNGLYTGLSHPVSSQLIGDNFPVAVTEMQPNLGPTKIMFHTIANDNLAVSPGQQSIYTPADIGALAYANINGNTYLVGGTFNSKRLYIWRAYGENRISGFQLIANNIDPKNFMTPAASLDENWSKYNSFWMGKLREDGRVVLFATHGPIGVKSYADIFEVQNLHNPSALRLIKIHKKTKSRWTTNRPYFLEGTFPIDGPTGTTSEIHALPDDFKVHSSYYLFSTYFRLEYKQKNCYGNKIYLDNEDELIAIDEENNTLAAGLFQMKISPNPSSSLTDKINVQLVDLPTETEYVQLLIFDLKGSLIKEMRVGRNSLSGTTEVDISDLEKGMYVLRAFTKDGISTSEKFVKM